MRQSPQLYLGLNLHVLGVSSHLSYFQLAPRPSAGFQLIRFVCLFYCSVTGLGTESLSPRS